MKFRNHIFSSFAAIIIALTTHAQTVSTDIAFEERVFNFGTILEAKGKVTHTFIFENKGKSPVTITDVHSSCGCIGKVMTKGPVKPGNKGKVTITFDPVYKSGFFSKEIIVFSKEGKEFNRIWVEGNITPAEHPITDDYPYDFGNGMFLRLKVIAFGYMKADETKYIDLHYANNTNEAMTLSFVGEGKTTGLQFKNPGKINPKAKGIMRISYTMTAPGNEDILLKLVPYINNKKASSKVEVRILSEKKRMQKNNSAATKV